MGTGTWLPISGGPSRATGAEVRLVYRVSPRGKGWEVRRGHTEALCFDTFEGAVRAADNLARNVVGAGDTGVVSIQGPEAPAVSTFHPDMPPRPASIRFNPEQDDADRAERLAHAEI